MKIKANMKVTINSIAHRVLRDTTVGKVYEAQYLAPGEITADKLDSSKELRVQFIDDVGDVVVLYYNYGENLLKDGTVTCSVDLYTLEYVLSDEVDF